MDLRRLVCAERAYLESTARGIPRRGMRCPYRHWLSKGSGRRPVLDGLNVRPPRGVRTGENQGEMTKEASATVTRKTIKTCSLRAVPTGLFCGQATRRVVWRSATRVGPAAVAAAVFLLSQRYGPIVQVSTFTSGATSRVVLASLVPLLLLAGFGTAHLHPSRAVAVRRAVAHQAPTRRSGRYDRR
jgi:hypothetical protein